MSVIRIATRYAKSLLELSTEQNKVEAVYADMQQMLAAVQNRDLLLLMKSPIVHSDKKIAVIDAIFKGKINELTLAYVHLLINKGREMFLPEIVAEYVHQYKVMKSITIVRVTTAVPMSDDLIATLVKKLQAAVVTADNIEIVTKIDPKLIGGFVLEFDDKRYDASVSNKLNELKSEFKKNLYIKEF